MTQDFEYAGRELDLGFAHKFRLEGLIAETRFGVVCRATWLQNGCSVALKTVLDPDRLERQQRLDSSISLQREASLLSRVHGGNVVRFVHHGTYRQMPVLVLEALDQTLAEYVSVSCHAKVAPRLPLSEALMWVRHAAQGLAAIHRAGLQHLDIKRTNLLLTPSSVLGRRLKISDFDTCTADDGKAHPFEGTPGCLAPEQVRAVSRRKDGRYLYVTNPQSDCYALGLLLFQLVTGERTEFSEHNRLVMKHDYEQGLWRERESFTGELTSRDLSLFAASEKDLMPNADVNSCVATFEDQNTWHPMTTAFAARSGQPKESQHDAVHPCVSHSFDKAHNSAVALLQKLCAPQQQSRPANGQAVLALIDATMLEGKRRL